MAVDAPRKRGQGYGNVAYWEAHPEEAEREIARIRAALIRIGEDDGEIDRSIARVRKVMAGGSA